MKDANSSIFSSKRRLAQKHFQIKMFLEKLVFGLKLVQFESVGRVVVHIKNHRASRSHPIPSDCFMKNSKDAGIPGSIP
jgi:hypothetical protein